MSRETRVWVSEGEGEDECVGEGARQRFGGGDMTRMRVRSR